MTRAIAVLILLVGCDNGLATGALIDRPRLLGAQVEIAADPSRASPLAGEHVIVHWLVAGEAEWTYSVDLCRPLPINRGIDECDGDPLEVMTNEIPDGAPSIAFDTPPISSVLVTGSLCANGCEGDGSTVEHFAFEIPIGTENHHPSIPSDAITIGGMPWVVNVEPVREGCAGHAPSAQMPRLARSDDAIVVGVATQTSDRELYTRLELGPAPHPVETHEELRLTSAATAGLFARASTVVYDEASANVEIEWDFPAAEAIPNEGLTTHFYFMLGDGRGGMSMTERFACITP